MTAGAAGQQTARVTGRVARLPVTSAIVTCGTRLALATWQGDAQELTKTEAVRIHEAALPGMHPQTMHS